MDKGIQVRKIHDLGALLQQCLTKDPNFESLKEEYATLTDYYAPTRYPDIAEYKEWFYFRLTLEGKD